MDGCSLPRVVLTDRDLALMNVVDRVFPESTALLCKWHIGRNVLTNCKKLFEEKHVWESFYSKWFYLVDSDTTEEYSKRLLTIEQSFHKYPKALNYIKKYKEKFVKAWTNRSMHCGNRRRIELKVNMQGWKGIYVIQWAILSPYGHMFIICWRRNLHPLKHRWNEVSILCGMISGTHCLTNWEVLLLILQCITF